MYNNLVSYLTRYTIDVYFMSKNSPTLTTTEIDDYRYIEVDLALLTCGLVQPRLPDDIFSN
jgi:hypothetical protein